MRERPPADTFAPLAEAELATIPAGDSPGECIIPVPPDAPPMPRTHPKRGKPSGQVALQRCVWRSAF